MITVLRDVLGQSLSDLSAARATAVSRGRKGALNPDDARLPTSTLSNLGPFDIDSFTGIVVPGQTSLITVGRIRRVPFSLGENIVSREITTVALNADHRALDGADAARLLVAFANQLENPTGVIQEGPLLG
jgi:pyruvate/2-oxoglutarate dehydrogenase complex dihydrolipoamide acyltransferase (E2) component